MENKVGYCPLCDKEFERKTDDIMIECPNCGHHLNLHIKEES